MYRSCLRSSRRERQRLAPGKGHGCSPEHAAVQHPRPAQASAAAALKPRPPPAVINPAPTRGDPRPGTARRESEAPAPPAHQPLLNAVVSSVARSSHLFGMALLPGRRSELLLPAIRAGGSDTALHPSGDATGRVGWGRRGTPSQSNYIAGTYACISVRPCVRSQLRNGANCCFLCS